MLLVPGLELTGGIAVDDEAAFASVPGGLLRVPLDGSKPLLMPISADYTFAMDDIHVHAPVDGWLVRVRKRGGAVEALLERRDIVTNIAADAGGLYWASHEPASACNNWSPPRVLHRLPRACIP